MTIYLIAYNEEYLLPYTIAWYRHRFPLCEIVVYDNFSTDDTSLIARQANCHVRKYFTDGKMDEEMLVHIKNTCWQGERGWVIVCDVDEWLDIWPKDLDDNATLLRTTPIDMVGEGEAPDRIQQGVVYGHPGKLMCFNARFVDSMNYTYGCHEARPVGILVFSDKVYAYQHYKWLSLEYITQRHALLKSRRNKHSQRWRLGIHYLWSARKIRRLYKKMVQQRTHIKTNSI